MQRTCLFNSLSLCFTIALSVTATIDAAYAVQGEVETEFREYVQQNDSQNLTGKITDIIITGGISYVEVDTGKEKVWVAGTLDNSLGKGDTISFSTAMPMQNFHSKSLDRDFPVLYFVKQFITDNQASNKVAPSGQTGKSQAHHPVTAPTARTPGEVIAGRLLHDALLDGLNTQNKSLSEYKGMPLIINVWASWCSPCRAEMGSLERLAKRYNGKKFNIIGISTDDYRDKATAFIDQAALSFENYIDHALLMDNMLGATTIPLTVLVDADGRLLLKVRGSREWDSPEILRAIGNVFQIKLM
jgi:thiol-disulfide isomerase/thioredoxin